MEPKITVIGAGNVGASAAHRLAVMGFEDLVLVDAIAGVAEGKALDLSQSMSAEGLGARISGGSDMAMSAGSDIVIITAGMKRKPGMSRSDLLMKNASIMEAVASGVKEHAPDAIVIVVANPLDVMTWVCRKVTGFNRSRVIGMAGLLDSARFSLFAARAIGVSALDVHAMVLGGHGDSMVPLLSSASVNGVRLADLLSREELDALVERTRKGGAEIVGLLKTASAFYAPGACAANMAAMVAGNTRRLIPASICLEGEYGMTGVAIGVPLVLGSGGMEKIVEIELPTNEIDALRSSADAVRQDIDKL